MNSDASPTSTVTCERQKSYYKVKTIFNFTGVWKFYFQIQARGTITICLFNGFLSSCDAGNVDFGKFVDAEKYSTANRNPHHSRNYASKESRKI